MEDPAPLAIVVNLELFAPFTLACTVEPQMKPLPASLEDRPAADKHDDNNERQIMSSTNVTGTRDKDANRVQSIMASARLRQEEFARLLEEHEQIVNEINRVETKISNSQTSSLMQKQQQQQQQQQQQSSPSPQSKQHPEAGEK